ncbi:MAG: mechanosensitive ion channel [Myxococcota bacterium]
MTHSRPAPVPARLFAASVIATLLVAFGFALLPSAARGAPASADPGREATSDLAAEIESLRRALQASAADGALLEGASAQLDAAVEDQRAADQTRAAVAALRADAASPVAPVPRSAELDDARALRDWAARIPADADSETLEGLLEHQRNRAAELSDEIENTRTALAQILSRPAENTDAIADLRRKLDALSLPIEAAEGEPSLATEARHIRRLAERQRTEAELTLREAERDTSLDRQRRRELALRELDFEHRAQLRRIEWLQTQIAERARRELERRVAQLTPAPPAVSGHPSVATNVAQENQQLGQELLRQTDALAADREDLSELEPERERVVAALNDSRTRLELGGANEAVGRWLWSERRRLESSARLGRRLEDLRRELADLRLRRVTLSDSKRSLADIPAAARSLLESSQALADDDGTIARAGATLESMLRERAELLELLEPVLQRRVQALERAESTLQQQIDATHALRQLLDRYLLWTPSHAPIDSSWFERVPEGLSDLVKPSRLATTLELARDEIADRPLRWAGAFFVLIGLIELRRRAPAQIREHEALTRQIGADHIGVTLDAFLWTLVAALPGPALLALLGSLLQNAGSPGRYSDSVGRACLALVLPLFAIRTLRWSAIEQGLGHAHLRWLRARRIALRRGLSRATAIVLPMYFVSALAFIRNLDLPNDVQARTAIVIACGALAWTFWRLLDAGQIWVVRGVETEPSTLRKLLRGLLPLNFVFVAGLALAGYVYSAGLVLQAWIASISVIIAVGLAVGLLGRWFLVGERRLALRRLEEQRAAATSPTSDEGGREPGKADVTLEQVNAQTQSILRMLRIGLLSIGLVWVWSGVLPAITRLDEIVLWTFSDVGADGLQTVQAVSLMGALFGCLALALTIVASRNLPGLIELGLLSQTNIDAASRYAITSILRYLVVIAGTLLGLELLGLRWSQLQWMAAALTVGLGFGLQEIFANFVSGLILLVERPFRVGDVISVGDLTGRVTRIRTRATTILDFDNREIVVPNKSFITGQLLNWTLSDTTTRLTLKVGVAYGTAAEQVHRLLLDAATAHPRVLSDPAPRSWFMAFGASSLDFELRVFVGNLDDRLQVQSELHAEIARRFAEHAIEIAFPQMDVHVRDLPEGSPTPS